MIYFINVYPFADDQSWGKLVCNTFVETLQHRTVSDLDYKHLIGLCETACKRLNEKHKDHAPVGVHVFEDMDRIGICEIPFINENQMLCKIRFTEVVSRISRGSIDECFKRWNDGSGE